jgi:demethylmenaquinone methyltransferase/2-methoxy-6-polyprenyl-1,4-benzoquinol methylase
MVAHRAPALYRFGMAVSDRKDHARTLFAGIAGDYDRWANILSFGQDRRWHDAMVERLAPALEGGAGRAVDVACGTAAVSIAIARRYDCTVLAIDQSPEMLNGARERVRDAGFEARVTLAQAEAERLPLQDGEADALTHTYLLRYVDDPQATLVELARGLRPGGIMASLDFGVPDPPALHAWRAWTRIGLPTAGRVAGPGWLETGRFLGPSIESFWDHQPLPELLAMWARAGMRNIRGQRLSLGGGVVIWGERE